MDTESKDDPDRKEIDRLYPSATKVGAPFEMKTGSMKGEGTCIRRRLTRSGIMFTILFMDGSIREWEWWD